MGTRIWLKLYQGQKVTAATSYIVSKVHKSMENWQSDLCELAELTLQTNTKIKPYNKYIHSLPGSGKLRILQLAKQQHIP